MKRSLLFFLLAPALALAVTVGIATWTETQAATRAVPTTSSTDGISLLNVTGFRVTVCAGPGQAITGGNVVFWLQTLDGVWQDNPKLLQALSSSGQQCQAVGGDWPVAERAGRFLPASSGVTETALDGGTSNVTMRVEAQLK